LIKQGGVEIDGVRIDDPRKDIDLSKPVEFLLRAGKKEIRPRRSRNNPTQEFLRRDSKHARR